MVSSDRGTGHEMVRDELTGRVAMLAPGRAAYAGAGLGEQLPTGSDPCPFCPGEADALRVERGRVCGPDGTWAARSLSRLGWR